LKSKELSLPKIPTLAENSIERLSAYAWPGNVRELQNIIERELILNPSGPLSFKSLLLKEESFEDQPDTVPANESVSTLNLDEIITSHIEKVLIRTKGRIHGKNGAAVLLGVNASTLINRMKKLGIKYKKSDMYR
jgi:DNA-binding NtrC family response regulator